MKPLFDRVVLEIVENEEEMKGGIILPAVAQEKSQIAKVVEVGNGELPDGKSATMQVKKGDKVIFAKYTGTEVEEKGKKFVIVRQADILAIID